MSDVGLVDLLIHKLGKEIEPQEPKMYSIQLQVRGPVPICVFAATVANVELGTAARYSDHAIVDVIEDVFDKTDWLDITKEMPKDIAEAKMEAADKFGHAGLMICGCGKNFTLRLGKAD